MHTHIHLFESSASLVLFLFSETAIGSFQQEQQREESLPGEKIKAAHW